MNFLEKYLKAKNYLGNESNKLKVLEDTSIKERIGFDGSESSSINKDALLNENIRLAKEDAFQQYQSKKKSIFLAYLLLFFTYTVIPNFYAGRKRWSFIQLIGLISIIIFLLIFTIIDFPKSIYPFLDTSLLFLILGVWLFDFCTLWYAVVHYNSKLYDSLFQEILHKHKASTSSIVSTRQSSAVLPTIHKDKSQLRAFTSSATSITKRSLS